MVWTDRCDVIQSNQMIWSKIYEYYYCNTLNGKYCVFKYGDVWDACLDREDGQIKIKYDCRTLSEAKEECIKHYKGISDV